MLGINLQEKRYQSYFADDTQLIGPDEKINEMN